MRTDQRLNRRLQMCLQSTVHGDEMARYDVLRRLLPLIGRQRQADRPRRQSGQWQLAIVNVAQIRARPLSGKGHVHRTFPDLLPGCVG